MIFTNLLKHYLKPDLLITLTILFLFIGCTPHVYDKNIKSDEDPALSYSKKRAEKQETGKPFLIPDTGAHMALINEIALSSDGSLMITAGDDKVIRVWDMAIKSVIKKFSTHRSSGTEGMIYTIALSPDDKYLAIGGLMEYGWGEESNYILIYDLKEDKLHNSLKSHKDVVTHLSFSKDGKYLASASADNLVKVWDAETDFQLIDTISEHSDSVYAVRLFRRQGEYRVLSAALDGRIVLYSLKEKRFLNMYEHNDKLKYLAVSSNHIASTGGVDNKILILDHDLNLLKAITSETKPEGVAFSADGSLLLAGAGGEPSHCQIYDSTREFTKLSTFKKHDNLTMALAFVDNETVVTAGGNNFDIYFWNPYTSEIKTHLTGDGKPVWAVGVKGAIIGFGNKIMSHVNEQTPLEKVFNLAALQVGSYEGRTGIKRNKNKYRDYSLSPVGESAIGSLNVNKGNRLIGRISEINLRINTFGFTEKGTIIVGGSSGGLKAYNLEGREMAQFTGHTGEVVSIASDGYRLVSGASDQTIKIWDLKKLDAFNNRGAIKIFPELTLFISKNDEWLIWNEESYFNSSKNGENYVTFMSRKSYYDLAKEIPSEEILDNYFKPNIQKKGSIQ